MFGVMPASIEHIRAGKLRALAVTGTARSKVLPDLPTVGEFLPGYEVSGWYGIGVPKGTTPEIAEKLNKEINAAVVESKMQDRLADLGAVATPMTPGEFGKFIADEVAKWAKVVKFAGIKPG
jgi:tripartite-type tricarboxylate transporter receptor subunit TctC